MDNRHRIFNFHKGKKEEIIMDGIYFDNATKRFDDITIFENSTFRVDKGVTLLISPNGSGKSTIIYLIMGNYRINSGEIYVNGYNPVNNHRLAFLNTSLMPENPVYFGSGTVREHISLFSRLKGVASSEIYGFLSYFKMEHIINSRIVSLSMGEAQILYISCYLSGNYKLYIFDEPNSNLDQPNRRRFAEAVKLKQLNSNSIFLITSHINDELNQQANQILTISGNKVRAFYRDDINIAYALKFYDIKTVEGKLKGLKHFMVNDSIVIKNASIRDIIDVIPESNIKEITRIPPAMVEYYENQK